MTEGVFYQAVKMFNCIVRLDILTWEDVGIDLLCQPQMYIWGAAVSGTLALASFFSAGGCSLADVSPTLDIKPRIYTLYTLENVLITRKNKEPYKLLSCT